MSEFVVEARVKAGMSGTRKDREASRGVNRGEVGADEGEYLVFGCCEGYRTVCSRRLCLNTVVAILWKERRHGVDSGWKFTKPILVPKGQNARIPGGVHAALLEGGGGR